MELQQKWSERCVGMKTRSRSDFMRSEDFIDTPRECACESFAMPADVQSVYERAPWTLLSI